MKSRKEQERTALIIVYQNPGDKKGRSEPSYIDAECREQKSIWGVGYFNPTKPLLHHEMHISIISEMQCKAYKNVESDEICT